MLRFFTLSVSPCQFMLLVMLTGTPKMNFLLKTINKNKTKQTNPTQLTKQKNPKPTILTM